MGQLINEYENFRVKTIIIDNFWINLSFQLHIYVIIYLKNVMSNVF